MVTAAIIFCTLLLSFIEKKHLFVRPIKDETVVIICLLVGTAIFSGVKEYRNDKQQDNSANVIDSLNGASKALAQQIIDLRKEARSSQKEYEDSLRQYGNSSIEQTKRIII